MVQTTYSFPPAQTSDARCPRFEIHGRRCPQLLARVAGMLAARTLVPTELHARKSCAGLWIAFDLNVDRESAERIAEKLRAIVTVDAVMLIHVPQPSCDDRCSGPV